MHEPAPIGPLVVEESLAPARPGAVVVPRPRRGRAWGPLSPELVLDALDAAGGDALVLARGAEADPGAAALGGLARVRGRDTVILPAERLRAAWVVAMARAWWQTREAALVRRVQALASMAAACPADEPASARLGARALSRVAAQVWRPCRWCASGGGLPGGDCARCGALGGPA